MRREWRENDLFVAYARGELEGEEEFEFTERLANDPEFAARYERFLEIDLVADLAAHADDTRARRPGSLLLLATLVVVIVSVSIWLWYR